MKMLVAALAIVSFSSVAALACTQDELTKKLVSKSYHEAIEQEQLRVVSLTNLEDVQFGNDKSMRFRATVVTAPEFKLPEYKSIPVELPSTEVKREDVDLALERLRDQSADFVDVPERGIEMEDFVVIDFEGTVDGKPMRRASVGEVEALVAESAAL